MRYLVLLLLTGCSANLSPEQANIIDGNFVYINKKITAIEQRLQDIKPNNAIATPRPRQ